MKPYDKIERFNKEDVRGILKGIVYVQEKIDGANASVYFDSSRNAVIVCSRNREIAIIGENTVEIVDTFRGLVEYVRNHFGILAMVKAYPDQIFYGEWMVKHSISYPESIYHKLYFYDIDNASQGWFHLTHNAISIFKKYEVQYVPILKKLIDPSIDEVREFLNINTFEGSPSQEGIVIKNFDFKNKWGRSPYAKIVNEEFREKNKRVWKQGKKGKEIEEQIALTYVTSGRVKKQMQKMFDGQTPVDERRTGELLQRVYNDVVVEEIGDILKKFKNPTINFRTLRGTIYAEVRRIFFNILEGRNIDR